MRAITNPSITSRKRHMHQMTQKILDMEFESKYGPFDHHHILASCIQALFQRPASDQNLTANATHAIEFGENAQTIGWRGQVVKKSDANHLHWKIEREKEMSQHSSQKCIQIKSKQSKMLKHSNELSCEDDTQSNWHIPHQTRWIGRATAAHPRHRLQSRAVD